MSVLGRSLYLATTFENDCRVLVFALKMKDPALAEKSENDFAKLVSDAILDRLVNLNRTIANSVGLPENYRDHLDSAREARNYIAHSAGDDLGRLLVLPNGEEQWREAMAERIDELAIGKVIVEVLLSGHTAMARPTKEEIESFPKIVKRWALCAKHDG